MNARWSLWFMPPLALTLLMLGVTQYIFLKASVFTDEGLGQSGDTVTLENYISVITDTLYLHSMRLTLTLSLAVVAITLLMTYPVAYTLARMAPRAASFILAAIVCSSFVSVAIKASSDPLLASEGRANKGSKPPPDARPADDWELLCAASA